MNTENTSHTILRARISDLERDNAGLREENRRLRAALASGLCSAHQEPDPLNCDTCNAVKTLTAANMERMKQIEELQAANVRLADARWDLTP